MHSTSKYLVSVLAAAAAFACQAAPYETRVESCPSNHLLREEILLHLPAGKVSGLLLLLAGGIHDFDEKSGATASMLPRLLATNGVMTLIAAPRPGLGAGVGLYARDAVLQEMDDVVAGVLHKYSIQDGRVALGGFSAGGIGAMRFAEFCAKGRHKTKAPVAVFAVDSPLDYERWCLAAERDVKRVALGGPPPSAEDRDAAYYLIKEFGGSPSEVADAYRRQSVVSMVVPDGGNARFLKDVPVRVYIEPDIAWRVQYWNQDAYNANLCDATALINVLRLLGNTNAELIATSGKGYRADGSRSPHSWSIVDEPALAEWLRRFLSPSR